MAFKYNLIEPGSLVASGQHILAHSPNHDKNGHNYTDYVDLMVDIEPDDKYFVISSNLVFEEEIGEILRMKILMSGKMLLLEIFNEDIEFYLENTTLIT